MTLAEAVRLLSGAAGLADPDEARSRTTAVAVKVVPHVDAAGLVIAQLEPMTSCIPAAGVTRALDELQVELGEGPALSVVDEQPEDDALDAGDLAGEDAERWPRFAPRAVEAGFRAVLSVRLSTDRPSGTEVLTLWAARPHAFDAAARELACLFGLLASSVLRGADESVHLRRACETDEVGVALATGILMERFAVGEDEAFHLLAHAAEQQDTTPVDLAHTLRAAVPGSAQGL